jgi:hypothetical protein
MSELLTGKPVVKRLREWMEIRTVIMEVRPKIY